MGLTEMGLAAAEHVLRSGVNVVPGLEMGASLLLE